MMILINLLIINYVSILLETRAYFKSSSSDKQDSIRIMPKLCLAKIKDIYNQTLDLMKQLMEFILKKCIHICQENSDSAMFNL